MIRGGTHIDNDEDLETYKELLEGEPQDGMDLERLSVGHHISMPPCVSPQDLAEYEKEGRACPRAELTEENAVSWSLVRYSMDERTRHLVPLLLKRLEDVDPDEAPVVALRVARTIIDPKLNAELERIAQENAEKRIEQERERQRDAGH